MIRRRTLLYVLLALAVPLPALALTRGSAAPAAAADLQVSASLDSCGTVADQIACKIDASWNSVPGATRYTARVTSPDGSVTDFGDVGSGGTSFWIPYVGNGTYTVTVAVYGTKRGSGNPELLAKSSSGAGGEEGAAHADSFAGGAASSDDGSSDEGAADDPGTDQGDTSCDDDPADPADDEPSPAEGAGVAAAEATPTEPAAADEASAKDEDDAGDAEEPDCAVAVATP